MNGCLSCSAATQQSLVPVLPRSRSVLEWKLFPLLLRPSARLVSEWNLFYIHGGEKKPLCAAAHSSGQMSLLSASEQCAYLITHTISESQSIPKAGVVKWKDESATVGKWRCHGQVLFLGLSFRAGCSWNLTVHLYTRWIPISQLCTIDFVWICKCSDLQANPVMESTGTLYQRAKRHRGNGSRFHLTGLSVQLDQIALRAAIWQCMEEGNQEMSDCGLLPLFRIFRLLQEM